MAAWPASGVTSVASMRCSVVLPAPFGPSRPVIAPSAARKLTPSTAAISRFLPKRLTRPSTMIIARSLRLQQRREQRWARAGREIVETRLRQRAESAFVDEFLDQSRRARVRRDDVAVAGGDDLPAVWERCGHFLAVPRRRHRIESAGQDQNRFVADERCIEVRGKRSARPSFAGNE